VFRVIGSPFPQPFQSGEGFPSNFNGAQPGLSQSPPPLPFPPKNVPHCPLFFPPIRYLSHEHARTYEPKWRRRHSAWPSTSFLQGASIPRPQYSTAIKPIPSTLTSFFFVNTSPPIFSPFFPFPLMVLQVLSLLRFRFLFTSFFVRV